MRKVRTKRAVSATFASQRNFAKYRMEGISSSLRVMMNQGILSQDEILLALESRERIDKIIRRWKVETEKIRP